MNKRAIRLLLSLALAWASIAMADVDSAIKGLRGPNSKEALAELTQLAEGGDAYACAVLGVLYQNGSGVPRDLSKAFSWTKRSAELGHPLGTNTLARMHLLGLGTSKNIEEARRVARSMAERGDADGQFVLFLANVHATMAAYQGPDGKPDMKRYFQLAERTASERKDDIEAYRALFKSAEQRHPGAVELLGLGYATQVGRENRQAALKLMNGAGSNPRLEGLRKTMQWLEGLGDTQVTPKLATDAMLSIAVAASTSVGDFSCKTPQLKRIQMTRDLTEAEYLPIGMPGAEKYYLLKGNWEEEWTFALCGKEAPVKVTFVADGMGGATYTSNAKPASGPGLGK